MDHFFVFWQKVFRRMRACHNVTAAITLTFLPGCGFDIKNGSLELVRFGSPPFRCLKFIFLKNVLAKINSFKNLQKLEIDGQFLKIFG